jgi:mannose-1-phosphate guanylyltransferase/mannose-6-phosphate isomerase
MKEGMTGYRPWGSYTVLAQGPNYQVIIMKVLPAQKLSYQLHYHRSELWLVVQGTALVTVEGKVRLARPGGRTYIPCGAKHSIHNPGKIVLQVLEVQYGAYLEDDDIIRFRDVYGRVKKR